MANPLEPFDRRGEDLYQSVVNEHIYHTLEPPNEPTMSNVPIDRNVSSDRNISAANAIVDGTIYDSLCKLDVMLPNGQMVPATLVRNANGRVIPLVEVNSQTLPHHQPRPPALSGSHQDWPGGEESSLPPPVSLS